MFESLAAFVRCYARAWAGGMQRQAVSTMIIIIVVGFRVSSSGKSMLETPAGAASDGVRVPSPFGETWEFWESWLGDDRPLNDGRP